MSFYMKSHLLYGFLAILACLAEITAATSFAVACKCGCLVEKPDGGGCSTCNQCEEAKPAFTLRLPKNRALATQTQGGLGLVDYSTNPGGGGGNGGGSYNNNNYPPGGGYNNNYPPGGYYNNNNPPGGGGEGYYNYNQGGAGYYDNNNPGGGIGYPYPSNGWIPPNVFPPPPIAVCDPAKLGCHTGKTCNNCQCCRGYLGGCWKPNTPFMSIAKAYYC